MKEKVLCEICNREFETEEEQMEWDNALCKHLPKTECICPDCKKDLEE